MNDFRHGLSPSADTTGEAFVHVIGNRVWRADEAAHPGWARHYIGNRGPLAIWAVDVPWGEDPSDGAALDLYSLHARVDGVRWAVEGRAVQIVEWARTHRFCGRCGTPTEVALGERAMRCPSCAHAAFPVLAPAMITLVTRGEGRDEEALLAQGVNFGGPMYSCLAGFVEPGESLEDAVAREVYEEVSVEVGELRYVGSQPWPFPHSLMLGFRARYVAGEIVPDPAEIVDAGWFRRDQLPNVPSSISIARRLIDSWVAEEW